jgi:hypothetical protein
MKINGAFKLEKKELYINSNEIEGNVEIKISAAVLIFYDQFKIILSRNDNRLSFPTGVWDGKKTLINSVLTELGKEIIVASDEKYSFWLYERELLEEEFVKSFAEGKQLKFSGVNVPIEDFILKNTVSVYLDELYQGSALVTKEDGNMEIIFLFRTFYDGLSTSFLRGGCQQEVGVFSLIDLINEEKTAEVEVVEKLLRRL